MTRLPGKFKLFGSALRGIGKLFDPLSRRIVRGPLLKTEVQSILGGSAGAGVGSLTYDTLNEQAGVSIACFSKKIYQIKHLKAKLKEIN